jgi:hypothetical protein
LGAARTDAGAAISLQLEDAVGDGGGDVVELLLLAVSWSVADHAKTYFFGLAPTNSFRNFLHRRGDM